MPSNTNRRRFLKYAGVGTTIGLAGCTRGGSSDASPSTNGSDGGQTTAGNLPVDPAEYTDASIDWTQFEGSQINIGAVNHAWVKKVKPLVPVFEELTGIDVVWNVLPEQKFRTKRLTDVSTGAGKFDAFFMGHVVNQFREAGWLQPLDPYMQDDSLFDEEWYAPNDLTSLARQWGHGSGLTDKWTGLPITIEVQTTFYRKDLYEKHGLSVPETASDLMHNAKVIHENEDDVVGALGRGQKGYGMNIYIMNNWLRQFGGEIWTDYLTDSGLDSQAALDAGHYYVDMLQQYGPDGVASMTWSDVLSAMQQGQAGHIVSDANLFWGSLTDPSSSEVAEDIGVAKVPVPDTEGGQFGPNGFAWTLSTSKAAANSEAAFLFMVWATSKPTQRYMAIQEEAPFMTRSSIWADSDYKDIVGTEFAEVSLASLKAGKSTPNDAKFPEWGQEYSVQLQQAIGGSKSVTDALTEAAKTAESVVSSE
ncbi:maltose ABC transporter substrate-binding protein [Halarchaeum grantii]|uniref:Maltose ABC transporter substrate-binding protein n=1 Tax=Halarchaeum grantii TaxID=1193105 RepID=A0A830FDP5_9EURY|nr:sugar ABC transporter substrate-binding protein [Halarchaeum grantii]GGL44780.1 maltose ABC transporter substrate-binding protein [Halarchaeum grantii]